jgi:hypothetical protein
MKNRILTALLTLTTLHLLADENIPGIKLDSYAIGDRSKISYVYFKIQMADQFGTSKNLTMPGMGLGYRHSLDLASCIDISGTYSGQFSSDENYFYAVPKVSYLRYASPLKLASFYYGAGLGWGGIQNKQKSFQGIIPTLTLGIEMGRGQKWKSLFQLDISQPLFEFKSFTKASVNTFSGPAAEVSAGYGF